MTDQTAVLQLMQVKGLGPRTLGRTLIRLAQEQRAAADLVAAPAEELIAHYGIKPEVARAIAGARPQAEKLAGELEAQGIRLLIRDVPGYPVRLVGSLGGAAPPVLFVAGNAALLDHKAVAFSGARDASEEGLRRTASLTRSLAERGIAILSGYANGVDLTAHRAALECGGRTGFVLAEGILRFRSKPAVADLLSDENFVVISEFAPRLPWSVGNAMQRNRTILGLANAAIIVEAGLTGGTFAAGETALEMDQLLFVVTYGGPPASAMGNAVLIARGGRPLLFPGDPPTADVTAVLDAVQSRKGDVAHPSVRETKASSRRQPDLFDLSDTNE